VPSYFFRVEKTVGRGMRSGVTSRPAGIWKRGYPRSEEVLQATFQDRHPNLDQPVGAAPAPAHGLLLGHGPADDPVDH
jgi:hypothetical protein